MPEPANSLLPSPTRTSAPLLSYPAMTDILSNFQLFSSRAGSSKEPDPQERSDAEDQLPGRSQETSLTSDRTASGRGRPRGRLPGLRRGSTTSSSRITSRANRSYTRPRGRVRTRARSRTLERAMTLPNIPRSMSPDQQAQGNYLLHKHRLISYDVIEAHDIGVEPAVPVTVVATT